MIPALAVAGYAAAVAVTRDATQWILAAPLAVAPMLWWLVISPTAWVSLFFVVVLGFGAVVFWLREGDGNRGTEQVERLPLGSCSPRTLPFQALRLRSPSSRASARPR